MEKEPIPSVRVEVDSVRQATNTSGPAESPTQPDGSGRDQQRLPLLAAAGAVLALLVLVIALLRPDDGQTAAGTERGPATTTSTTTTASTTSSLQPPTAPSRGLPENIASGVELLARGFALQTIAADGDGYLGLTWETSSDFGPGLLRSVDGLEWVEVAEVTIGGTSVSSVDFVANNEFASGQFFGLAQTRSGYSMLFQSSGSAVGVPMTRRLVSEDAVNWVVDGDFPAETPFDLGMSQTGNSDFTLIQTQEEQSGLLRGMLSDQLVDPTRLPETICLVDQVTRAEGSSVRLVPCDFGEPTSLTADDFVAPELMEQVARCAEVLSIFSGTGNWAVYELEVNRSRPVSFPGRFLVFPSLFADGSVALLDISHSVFTQDLFFDRDDDPIGQCEGFAELATPEADLVVYFAADGQERSVEFPDRFFDLDQDSGTGFTAAIGREFVVILGTEVWAFNVDSLVWRQPDIDLPEVFDEEFLALQRVEGRPAQVAWFGASQIGLIDFEEETVIVEDREWSSPFVGIHYADDKYLFAEAGSQTVRIEMPGQN